jgi:hypothetical protein
MEFSVSGRWPANLILQHLDGCECEGTKKVRGTGHHSHKLPEKGGTIRLGLKDLPSEGNPHADADGKETVANWICVEGCSVRALDEQSGTLKSGAMDSIATGGQYTTYGKMYERRVTNPASEGGASRFFKQLGGSSE